MRTKIPVLISNTSARPYFIVDGVCNSTGIKSLANYLSTDSKLFQNFPNQFTETPQIAAILNAQTHVKLAVNSSLGEEIQDLMKAIQSGGETTVAFNSSGIAVGTYYFSLTTLEERELRMMLRVK